MDAMSRLRVALLACVCIAPFGCFSDSSKRSSSWLDRFRPFAGSSGSDLVAIDVAVLERPAGDRYLNVEMWQGADEQVLAPETRVALEDNGIRVGQVGGLVPAGLQGLLTSDRSNNNARRFQRRAGIAAAIPVGGERIEFACRLVKDGKPTAVNFDHAQCTLEITPLLTAEGKAKLSFVPLITHGERKGWSTAALALPGQGQRPTETYAHLRWELTAALNDFIVIGNRHDRPDSLGFRFFVDADENRAMQRVLVVRAGKLGSATPSFDERYAPDKGDGSVMPLASQAATSTARGARDR
jgi:hypothetical protein